MTDRSFNTSKKSSKDLQGPSLYEILQDNKVTKQEEFYEESKAELSGRNLTDDDAKFLMSVEESKRLQELAIKKQTDAALHEFRVKHELLSREYQVQDSFNIKTEPIHATISKMNDKVKSSIQQAPASETAIKSKRNLLGIAPKAKK